jgi:DNA-binding transcriptional LysR family regulator
MLAVAAGAGLAVLPASAAERYSTPGVRFVPLDPSPACEIAVISRAEASTTVTAFLRIAFQFARSADRARTRALMAA